MKTEKKTKILLVEDNPDHAFLVKRALEKNSPLYSIKVVQEVEKCLKELQKEDFQIIVSDYNLPGSNGLLLLSKLKEKKVNIPVVMLTGSGNEEIAVRAMKEGAYDYVIKEPGYLKTIHLVIKRVLERYGDRLEKERLENDLKKKAAELEDANKKLAHLSVTDGMTGLYNYRYLSEVLEKECDRAKRIRSFLACIIVDIDFFKEINDKYGHPAGDYILKELSGILVNNLRSIDTVGRYGGDEFILILPETKIDGAMNVAEKLRETIEEKTFNFEDKKIKFTLSVGVASFLGEESLTRELVIKSADEALYKAKKTGRNKIEVTKKVV